MDAAIGVQAPVPPFKLLVDQPRLLLDSFAYLSWASHQELLNCELTVQFLHEEGSRGGVVREWLTLVGRSLFDPQLTLFSACLHRFFLNPGQQGQMHTGIT
ncbi:E3 ubiquitin-protein ligase ptr1-like [Brachypodium distachyon]|uniref:E3 ubiquitin-protein ligase ptr1-like n=1 Tax=Brachypodium distachyon TaxID=15368 RepID=UPI000D0D1836|nr:E3 ubiquitin-protein ligase ptr1-like [Brachypodium distachyon]|eukprot:XP_024313851.1 E3 ubiquitin-protein ligase ptr1-like [Brachypodium distachyon]